MNMSVFSNKKWKVTFMRGEGETYVFANTEEQAKYEAFGQYRKRRAEFNNVPMCDVIEKIEFID